MRYPRAHIALHRLVLVPRAMIAGHARTALAKRLEEVPDFAALDEALRIFLFDQLVIEMDAALQKASASVRNPVAHTRSGRALASAKDWFGSSRCGPVRTGPATCSCTNSRGRVIAARPENTGKRGIAEMATSVSSLTKLQRNAMVRAASAR